MKSEHYEIIINTKKALVLNILLFSSILLWGDIMSKIIGFHHIAIKAINFEQTVEFYKNAFNMSIKMEWGEGDSRSAMLEFSDGECIEIFSLGDTQTPQGKWLHVAFNVDSTQELFESAINAGAKVKMPPTEIDLQTSNGVVKIKIAFVEGLNGEELELFEYIN